MGAITNAVVSPATSFSFIEEFSNSPTGASLRPVATTAASLCLSEPVFDTVMEIRDIVRIMVQFQDPTMLIGALSKRTGVNIETIRYYERIGVMPNPPRTEGGHRVYNETHMKRLVFIRRSRELGFSLNETRALLKLGDGGEFTCGQVKEMTVAHIGDIRSKVADLRRMEKVLKEVASKCNGGDVPDCPILEVLSG